ncbi:hypothetical protein KBZ15_05570 [Cyanobium sp. BA20m-p-22]|uniref:hypothetical protein n=1 Tax=Cyanobium sp. BA20m-p-22 TaxID=2823704 RepID=UPI0020CB83D6|nr:hypothetical protein [Cyanobium sp. BA20m-p-22]MCP9909386.1 hypothetical protein [Cyanobium sp. BA20m-p-22]
MKPKNPDTISKKEKVFPGYLFSQYIVKQKDSEEDLAILSILDKTHLESKISTVNSDIELFGAYLSELQAYNSDEFFEILRGIHDLSVDILNIKVCPSLHTVIPHRDSELEIIGTLTEDSDEESILWSLVKIK